MKRQKGISTAWKVALCAVFGAVTIAIAQNKVIPCISLLQEAFGIDMTEAGWLSSVYNAMGIAMAFPGVIIVNRLGAKKVCLISLACGILGAGVGFFARNIGLLMVGRVGFHCRSRIYPAMVSAGKERDADGALEFLAIHRTGGMLFCGRGNFCRVWMAWRVDFWSESFCFGSDPEYYICKNADRSAN